MTESLCIIGHIWRTLLLTWRDSCFTWKLMLLLTSAKSPFYLRLLERRHMEFSRASQALSCPKKSPWMSSRRHWRHVLTLNHWWLLNAFNSTRGPELVADFAADLCHLTIWCNFGDFLLQTLRDKFVCGVRNNTIHKRNRKRSRWTRHWTLLKGWKPPIMTWKQWKEMLQRGLPSFISPQSLTLQKGPVTGVVEIIMR